MMTHTRPILFLTALVAALGLSISAAPAAGASLPEHPGLVTMQGKPLVLLGHEVKVGQKAPDFTVVNDRLQPVTLADTKGVRVFLSVPSLDTPVCSTEVDRFNQEASRLPGVTIYAVSADLPFAQKRWCGAKGVKNVYTLSDYQHMSFANAYGVHIKGLRLLARAVFVVNSAGTVVYRQLVPEIGHQPDFTAVLAAVRQAK